jgi:hypothetical protein
MSQQRKERKAQAEVQQEPQPDLAFRRKVIKVTVLVVALAAIYYLGYHRRAHKYDQFARCLTQKGVRMYGAYWCPHCSEQKELFDAAFKYAPYLECGVKGNTSQMLPACTDAGIKHFPTWQFPPVGERVEGVESLEDLSYRTGCPLP